MLPLLILAAIATPLLEIAVISQLLVWAPWPLVLALVSVGTVTGLVVLRQDGLSNLRRWRTAHRRKSAADALTITQGLRDVAGVLLAVPGVVTTLAGLVLLAYPMRTFLARRVVAADASRRRRRVPAVEVDRTPALPPPPRPAALEPVAAEDAEAAAWDAFAMAHAPAATGHIAGQSESHAAVVDTFFDTSPHSTAPVHEPTIPLAPPLPAVLAPPSTGVASTHAAQGRPRTQAPDGERSGASGDEPWGAFMEGRAWEDEPPRRRDRGVPKAPRRARKQRRADGGGADHL